MKNSTKRLDKKDKDGVEIDGERKFRRLEGKQKDKESDEDWTCYSCSDKKIH